MGARLTRSDFQWVYTDEPHTTRRREMLRMLIYFFISLRIIFFFLEKYPQIKQLMGHDWRIAIQVAITVLIQLTMAIVVRDLPWKFVWLVTYVISGTLNHSLSISFHESMIKQKYKIVHNSVLFVILVGHNLAFGNHRPIANRILGYIANLPLCIPSSVTFKKYHIDHHKLVRLKKLNSENKFVNFSLDFKVMICSIQISQHILKLGYFNHVLEKFFILPPNHYFMLFDHLFVCRNL